MAMTLLKEEFEALKERFVGPLAPVLLPLSFFLFLFFFFFLFG